MLRRGKEAQTCDVTITVQCNNMLCIKIAAYIFAASAAVRLCGKISAMSASAITFFLKLLGLGSMFLGLIGLFLSGSLFVAALFLLAKLKSAHESLQTA